MSEYESEASRLLEKKEFENCVNYVDSAIREGFESVSLHISRAEALGAMARHEDALPSFQYIIRRMSPKVYGGFRSAIKSSRMALSSGADRKGFWEGCNSELEKTFHKALECFLDGSFDVGESYFRAGLSKVFSENGPIEIWMESYRILRLAVEVGVEPSIAPGSDVDDFKVLMVSGMGWSGSGAVFDYFQEFSNVHPIKGESPYIENSIGGVGAIYGELGSRDGLIEKIAYFFFQLCLGFVEVKTGLELISLTYARKKSVFGDTYGHAETVRKATCLLASVLCESSEEKRELIFFDFARFVLNALVIGDHVKNDKVVLLDNVIKIPNIAYSQFFNNLHVFCTFRDPRSNFVALVREDRKFSATVDQYIESRKRALPSAYKKVERRLEECGDSSGGKVTQVQFEEFVMSEKVREELARVAGLDISQQNRYSKFRPWESARNVMLHQEHTKRDEITKIEEALGEYCFEIYISPLKKSETGV